jgi:hypothetical protein
MILEMTKPKSRHHQGVPLSAPRRHSGQGARPSPPPRRLPKTPVWSTFHDQPHTERPTDWDGWTGTRTSRYAHNNQAEGNCHIHPTRWSLSRCGSRAGQPRSTYTPRLGPDQAHIGLAATPPPPFAYFAAAEPDCGAADSPPQASPKAPSRIAPPPQVPKGRAGQRRCQSRRRRTTVGRVHTELTKCTAAKISR